MFVSLQFKLELKKEYREKLVQLMRKQSSAIRVAYRRLLINPVQNLLASSEGSPPLSLKPILVEGVWDRVRSRLASLEVGGASR